MPDSRYRGQAAGERFDPTTTEAFPSTCVTQLTLVRHGEVEEQESRVVRGQLDVPLSDEGRRQGRLLVDWCARAEPAPDVLLGSDLSRCADLARAFGAAFGLEPRLVPELREQSMGRWQGRTWAQVQEEHGRAVNDYWDDYVDARPPEGESLRDLYVRVGEFWDQALAEHAGRRILAVTHIGVIRSLLCRLLGIAPSEALRFAPAAGSVTQVLVSDAGAVLNTFGERPWLFLEPPEGP